MLFLCAVSFQERLLDFPLVHVVLGNEACDLDSAVSAIVYAYYLHEVSLVYCKRVHLHIVFVLLYSVCRSVNVLSWVDVIQSPKPFKMTFFFF